MSKEINPIEEKEQQIADLERERDVYKTIINDIANAINEGDAKKDLFMNVVDNIKSILKSHQDLIC